MTGCGFVLLSISTYWSYRYTRLARRLKFHEDAQLSKAAVVQALNQGVYLNAGGLFVTLLGVEAIALTLLAKTLTQAPGLALYSTRQLVEPLDLLVVQANINMLLAQFIGLTIASWLVLRLKNH